MNKKILLFLDFDGVLHGTKEGGKCFTKLSAFEGMLHDYQEIDVVFSTSWRFSHTLKQLTEYFSEDVRHRFIGVTPYLQEKWPPYIKFERHKEAIRYMEDIGFSGDWIAIDDSKNLYPILDNVIITDDAIGIDDVVESKIRNLLDKIRENK